MLIHNAFSHNLYPWLADNSKLPYCGQEDQADTHCVGGHIVCTEQDVVISDMIMGEVSPQALKEGLPHTYLSQGLMVEFIGVFLLPPPTWSAGSENL